MSKAKELLVEKAELAARGTQIAKYLQRRFGDVSSENNCILVTVEEEGVYFEGTMIPYASAREMARWLVGLLGEKGGI